MRKLIVALEIKLDLEKGHGLVWLFYELYDHPMKTKSTTPFHSFFTYNNNVISEWLFKGNIAS